MFSSHPPSYLYAPHRLYWGTFLFTAIATLAAPLYLLFSPAYLTIIGPIFAGLVALQLPAALIFYLIASQVLRTLTPSTEAGGDRPIKSTYGWVALATSALLGVLAVAYALPALAEQHLGWTFSAPFYGITEHFVDRYALWLGLFSLSLTLTPLIMLAALARSLPQVLGMKALAPLFLVFFAPLYFLQWGLSGVAMSWVIAATLLVLARYPMGLPLLLAVGAYSATHIALLLSSPSSEAALTFGVELPFMPLLIAALLVALLLAGGRSLASSGYKVDPSLG